MKFPSHGCKLGEVESEALRLLIQEKRLDFYEVASKIVAGSTSNSLNYGVRMLNGKRRFSKPAWDRVMVILGITTRDFVRFVSQLDSTSPDLFEEDPNLAVRIRLFGEYIALYDEICENPTKRVVAVDTTGCATQFTNWRIDQMYRGILQRNASFVRAFRRNHGAEATAMQRNFIVEPGMLTEAGIHNLEETLKLHLERGIQPGIVYKHRKMPSDVVGDIGVLSGKYCIDAGLIEGFADEEARLIRCVAKRGQRDFSSIADRVEWTNERENLIDVYCADRIPEVILDLRDRRKHLSLARGDKPGDRA